jgi:hypothetical protein
MIDTDRLRPKISPLDIWRIGASIVFVGFGAYFSVRFAISRLSGTPHAWTELILGLLILLYGLYRLIAAWRYFKRTRQEAAEDKLSVSEKK